MDKAVNKVVLANHSYCSHTTDEGDQLQKGLQHAGWTLSGPGFDGLDDVREVLERYSPEFVFVQDKRDWDKDNDGCFDKRMHWRNVGALRDSGVRRCTVVKDAGSVRDYQRRFYEEEMGSQAAVVYYHPLSVVPASGWLEGKPLVRTYHSVDPAQVRCLYARKNRKRGIVSGADSSVYPMRKLAVARKDFLGIDYLKHPGYGNKGCHTPKYLEMLSGYKVAIATASQYGFALRKIIESVCCGCQVVTDLPEYDELPIIDKWLYRISPNATADQLKKAIDRAEEEWDLANAIERGVDAVEFYDFQKVGERLDRDIVRTLCN